MKRLLTILFVSLSIQSAKAMCALDYIGIHPRDSHISCNSAFLIDFSEEDFNLRDQIKDLVFTAITTKGKRYKLLIMDTNFLGTMGQILLKLKSELKMGEIISIKIEKKSGDSLSGTLKSFAKSVAWEKWTARYKSDQSAPIFMKDSIKYLINDETNSSVHSYSISFNPQVNDNSISGNEYKRNGEVVLPFYFEVEFENQKFICTADGGPPLIGTSICGRDFYFKLDTIYTAFVRTIDASGNFSKQRKTFVFRTSRGLNEGEFNKTNSIYMKW